MDNISVKAFINRQGGTRSKGLMKEASQLFQWEEFRLLSIKAEHLPGIANTEADWLSRRSLDDGEWSLHPRVFNLITRVLGRPEVDLFASPDKAQVPVFLSQTPNPQVLGVNTLFYPWPPVLLYAFPPFPLIQAVFQQVRWFNAKLILVVLNWPCRPWYPAIVNMSVGAPLRLPITPDLLRQGTLLHPNPDMFWLTAWLLNGSDW